jgi:hypothetical protein
MGFTGAEGGRFRPEIDAVHGAVGIPERAMVGMIVLFAGRILHWPVAGHFHAARAEQRVEVHVRRAGEAVLGEELAIDLHAHFVGLLLHFDGCGSRVVEEGAKGGGAGGERESGMDHGDSGV